MTLTAERVSFSFQKMEQLAMPIGLGGTAIEKAPHPEQGLQPD